MGEYSVTPVDSTLQVIIQVGSAFRTVEREILETYLYELAEQMTDISDMYDGSENYKDSFEWILTNLFRISGVQLYSDGEIRLNISKGFIEDDKKCVFLRDSKVLNRKFDQVLYDEFERIFRKGL